MHGDIEHPPANEDAPLRPGDVYQETKVLGEQLGRGAAVLDLLAASPHVVEGHPTARSAWQLAQRLGISMPIIEQVHAMLHEGKDPKAAVRDLTHRDSRAEDN